MADNIDIALRIIAAVHGLNEIRDLTSDSEKLNAVLADLRDRAQAGLNPMGSLADATRGFGASVESSTEPVTRATTNLLKFAAAVGALGTGMGVLAYDQAKKYESAVIDLVKVLSDSDGPVEQYTGALDALAQKYGESSITLTQSMASFVQAGFDAKTALDLVATSLDVVRAGDVEASKASELLIAALKGFGVPADESAAAAQRLGNVWNEVSNRFATDTEQLAQGMADLSPIAKQAGFSFEETAGILTPVIEVFRSGSEAADGLKTGLLRLSDDSKPVQDALRAIGVVQTDANGQLRSGKDLLIDVALAFQHLDDNQKAYITQQLVGIDQSARMIQVFDNLGKSMEITQAAYEGNKVGADGYTSIQREVNKVLESAEVIALRTAESFRQLATTLGTEFKGPISGLVDATGDLARGFDEAAKKGEFRGLSAAVGEQLGAVERLFRQVAANIPDALAQVNFSPLIASIRSLGVEISDSFNAVLGDIDLTTVDGLAKAFQLAADGLAALINFAAGALDGMEPLFARFGYWARLVLENADSIARMAGEIGGLVTALNILIPIYTKVIATIFEVIGAVASAVVQIGLLVGAIKLLNAAGISIIPLLGTLAARIGALSVGSVAAGAAFTGLSGALLATIGAAGAAGYGIGTLLNDSINTVVGSLTGGDSLGTLIYDLVHGLDETEESVAGAGGALDAEALAAQRAAAAAKELEDAEREKNKALEEASAALLIQAERNEHLYETLAQNGLVWDETSGKIRRAGEALNGTSEASLAVQNAMRQVGLEYALVVEGITADGEKLIQAFRTITRDITTNATVAEATLRQVVGKARTEAELAELSKLWVEYGERVGLSQGKIAEGQELIADRTRKLKDETDRAKQAAEEAKKAFDQWSESLEKAETLHALQNLRVALEQMFREGKISAEQYKESLEEVRQKIDGLGRATGELSDRMQSLGDDYDRVAKAAERETKEVERSTAAAVQAAQIALEVAKAKGDEQEIRRATIQLAEAEAKAAQEVAAAKAAEAQAAWDHVAALEAEAAADGKLVAAEQEVIDKAREVAEAKQEEADAAEKTAEETKRAKETAEDASEAVRTIKTDWLDAADAASQYADGARRAAAEVYHEIMSGLRGSEISAWVWQRTFIDAFAAAQEAARNYIREMEALEAHERRLSSSAAQGVEDLRMRLLELEGTEEEIAEARQARERADIKRQIALMDLQLRRAELNGEATEPLERELDLLSEQLDLIDRIHNAEDRQRHDEDRRRQAEASGHQERIRELEETERMAGSVADALSRVSGQLDTLSRTSLDGLRDQFQNLAGSARELESLL